MSNRQLPPDIPSDLPTAVLALARRVAQLEAEVRALQAATGRMLPGDYRFRGGVDGAVSIVRVSTNGETAITPPL